MSNAVGTHARAAGPPGVGGSRQRLDTLLVAIALLAGLVIVGVAAHLVPPSTRHRHVAASVAPVRPTGSPVTLTPPRAPRAGQHTTLAVTLIGLAAGVALLALVGVALMFLVRSAPRWPRMWSERRRPADPPGNDARLVDDLRAVVEQGLGALDEGEVADVIVGCWIQLARAADRAGVALPASDTPEQTVTRIVQGTGVRAEPLRALADLYREARFSRHRLGATERAAARSAFAAVAADLGRAGDGFVAPDAGETGGPSHGGPSHGGPSHGGGRR